MLQRRAKALLFLMKNEVASLMNNVGSPYGTNLLLVGDSACPHPAKKGSSKVADPYNFNYTYKQRGMICQFLDKLNKKRLKLNYCLEKW